MPKTLYFYNDPNDSRSNTIRARLVETGLPFIELDMTVGYRKHNVRRGGPMVLVDVDGEAHTELPMNTSTSEITSAWNSAPSSSVPLIYVTLTTEKWNGTDWVVEDYEFTEGDKMRVTVTVKLANGQTHTGVNSKFKVPLYEGHQLPPNPDGTQVVHATDIQAALLPLQFINGVAVYAITLNRPMWICAVAGKTSKWLLKDTIRAVLSKPAT